MKTLFFQLESGAAGDMLAAALLGLVPDPARSLSRLQAMGLKRVSLSLGRAERCGLAGNVFDVSVDGVLAEVEPHHEHDHDHDHGHDHDHDHDHGHGHGHHHHASLADVRATIESLPLPAAVRADALEVYGLIAEAESRAHGKPVGDIHFHEVGTLDAIADIVCVCALIAEIAPDRIAASAPNAGGGTVRCAHGVLPVPAPATLNLLSGIPWRGDDASAGELLTPTGAALLRHFVGQWGPMPLAKVVGAGTGFGHRVVPGRTNAVRAFLCESGEGDGAGPNGAVTELMCNIDDMTGEQLGRACERLRAVPGALDVSLSPLQMKKNRPGALLRVICSSDCADGVAAAILKETSTFGVRRIDCARYELARTFTDEDLGGAAGRVRYKLGTGYGVEKRKREFDFGMEA